MPLPKNYSSLLSRKERELVEDSFRPNGVHQSWTILKRRVQLLRRLRDKYRDLVQRQKLDLRGREPLEHSSVAEGSSRTAQKVDIFSDTLRRYEDRLEAMRDDAAAGPADRRTA